MPTTRASAAHHSGSEVAEKPDLATKVSPAPEISSAEFSSHEVLPPGDKTPLKATSLIKATKSTGINRALRARQTLRFIRSEHLQKTDEAYNVIQTADPGFYSLRALAESEVGNENEEDWPTSWVGIKGAFQGWTKTHLKKWLTVGLPAHLAQKAGELQSANKEAKKTENKARDELPGATSTKASEIPNTTSKEQELPKANEQSAGEAHASQGTRSEKPSINNEASDKSVRAASETTTMDRPFNSGGTSLGIQSSIKQNHVEKGSGGSTQAGKKKDMPDLVDVSVPGSSTEDHPPRAPGPHPPAAAPAPLEPSIQDEMPRFGEIYTPGSQSPSLPIRFKTNSVSMPHFPDLNTGRSSSAGSLHADNMPTPSQHGHVTSSVQGSLPMRRAPPHERTSLSATRVSVQTDGTANRYDDGVRSGPNFERGGGLFLTSLAKTGHCTEKKAEGTLFLEKTANLVTEKQSLEEQLTHSRTRNADKELMDWGTRTTRDSIFSGFGICSNTTGPNESSAGPSEPGMTVNMGELGSTAHQGNNASNVIGNLTKVNLQRHEASSRQTGAEGEGGEDMMEEDPPAEWYEWYKNYHDEQRKNRKEANKD
ncbi:hypothetical protein BHE90_010607 [Fusarium euwallaceae]|uniref:Uncharacterized protein n=1 Tax=Fusarium euwallaceae TaxID=1147111 RepID=A0A430LGV2_9HYPO|nr:hypothetical protein BHE90_010607 [Fusarium euwallaceae]